MCIMLTYSRAIVSVLEMPGQKKSLQNQKWSDISIFGRTHFEQAMLYNHLPKMYILCMHVCMYFLKVYL